MEVLTAPILANFISANLAAHRESAFSERTNRMYPREWLRTYRKFYITNDNQMFLGDDPHIQLALDAGVTSTTVADKGALHTGYYRANPKAALLENRWVPALVVVEYTDRGSIPGRGYSEMTERVLQPLLADLTGFNLLKTRVANRDSKIASVSPLVFDP